MSINLRRCLVQCFVGKNYLSNLQKTQKYFLSNQRTCTNIGYENNPQFDYHEIKSYKEYLDERKINLGRVIVTLMSSLHITKTRALNIITEREEFRTMTRTQIIDNINLLHEEDIDESTIRDNVYILADSNEIIKQKIDIFKDANLEINSVIPLFQLPFSVIKIYGKRSKIDKLMIPNHKNRIHYLCSELEADMNYLCTKIVLYPFLLHVKIEKMIEVTQFLIDSGISKHHIIEDLLVYKYATDRIKERILRAKKANMKPIKPWVVRCLLDHVLSAELRCHEEQEFFQSCKNLEEYMSKEMNVDIEVIKGLLRRNPGIYSMNLKKLRTQLNLLKNFGYTGSEIFYVPRVFFCRNDSLVKKYNKWKDQGLGKPPLFLLATSMAMFNEKMKKELECRSLAKN
ncbi:uncharacterized protein [Chelonus insularis]|uniref:uncharacterized protein n=1 Tax=Chelonus insularis TaxID=460826 RepID=UPI00158DB440|nr:uncharacterized protein LOC118064138 [Chelonus insularis]